ncbi:YcnI family protein [Patulibacter sp. SYSU D01012]|uniref:YcnI family copper-binding membrane protein n=1 Tax=Patulibacter sp. SYSU D01012 TaxID=2817381 RepID=UPI001B310CB7|nr:YcnI family protein [Patulibacter sp. SYSU D01012]
MSTKQSLTVAGLATVGAVLAAPALASAHVTIQPPDAPAGSYAVVAVRVPNEQDDHGTTKVQVRFPPGVASARYEPVPGWRATVATRPAATPIDVHGERVTDEVDTITWTATGRAAAIAPGQFRDFPVAIRVPDGPEGTALTFKALQTYEGGDVVRWIGAADAETPAPTLTLEAAQDDDHGHAAGHAAPAAEDGDDDGGGSDAVAVVLGAVGLVAGLAGLGVALAARRRSA